MCRAREPNAGDATGVFRGRGYGGSREITMVDTPHHAVGVRPWAYVPKTLLFASLRPLLYRDGIFHQVIAGFPSAFARDSSLRRMRRQADG